MTKDILSEYGPDHRSSKGSTGSSGVTTDGGKPYNNPLEYCTPVGPSNQGFESPGNHGVNHGNKGTQGSY